MYADCFSLLASMAALSAPRICAFVEGYKKKQTKKQQGNAALSSPGGCGFFLCFVSLPGWDCRLKGKM